LRRYLPDERSPLPVELPERATVADLAAQLGITWGELGIVQVNGNLSDEKTTLHDGDLVEIFAPIGGG
jgi:sulfur carrier protein ThiS